MLIRNTNDFHQKGKVISTHGKKQAKKETDQTY
jgi:hypothetical protein